MIKYSYTPMILVAAATVLPSAIALAPPTFGLGNPCNEVVTQPPDISNPGHGPGGYSCDNYTVCPVDEECATMSNGLYQSCGNPVSARSDCTVMRNGTIEWDSDRQVYICVDGQFVASIENYIVKYPAPDVCE